MAAARALDFTYMFSLPLGNLSLGRVCAHGTDTGNATAHDSAASPGQAMGGRNTRESLFAGSSDIGGITSNTGKGSRAANRPIFAGGYMTSTQTQSQWMLSPQTQSPSWKSWERA